MAAAASSSSSSAVTLSAALGSLRRSAPSFSVQADWEAVLRDYSAAVRTGGLAAAEKLPKENRQFWASAATFGVEDAEQKEAIARLEDGAASAASAGREATPAAAAAAKPAAPLSLAAAAKAVRCNTTGPDSDPDLQLQFRTPLQLLAHSSSLSLTQLLMAPRATHSHLHPSGDVLSVDVNVQGTHGLSAAEGATVRVWDAQTGTLRADLVGHVGDVHLARWFPSGVVALSAGLDLSLKIWAVEPTAALATQLRGHSRPITQVRFLGRGRHLVTSSEDGTAKLWDVSTQQALQTYPAHKEDMPAKLMDALLLDPAAHPIKLSDSADATAGEVAETRGNLLLTGGSDGILRGYDLRTQGQVLMLPTGGRAGGIEALCAGPVPFSFTFGTTEGPLAVVDLRNKQALHTMRQDDAAITCIRPWSADSFWACNSTGAVNLWRLGSSAEEEARIVAQMTGVDCEPVHDLCITQTGAAAFVASHEAVRCYTMSAMPTGAEADTREWHGLQLPPRASAGLV